MIYPARIKKYYPETQTADVIISAERVHDDFEEINQTVDRAILEDVPIHTPSGGGWAVTFPILPDDTCLVILSAVGYDHWLYNDKDKAGKIFGQPAPELYRSFSEDDGFALVGFNTLPRAIQGYEENGSQWRNKTASQSIHLKPDGTIEISTNSSVVVKASSVVIDSPTTTMKGNLTVTGSATVSGIVTASDAIASGVSLKSHKHQGRHGTTSTPK